MQRILVADSIGAAAGGEGPAVSGMIRRQLTWTKAAIDALAADESEEIVIGILPPDQPHRITNIWFIPGANVTHHAANFATLAVVRCDLDGNAGDTLGDLSTSVDDMVKRVPSAFTLVAEVQTWTYPPETPAVRGTVLRLDITKTGDGVKIPQGALVVEYEVGI